MFKKTICAALACGLMLFIASVVLMRDSIVQYAHEYALSSTEKQFGSSLLAPQYEQFIRDIAQEMNITKPFLVRKTNATMLGTLGYYNAFVYHPQLWNFIPLCSPVFMYISEGFFEDLSVAEQRFLVGHELIHLREGHCSTYYQLCMVLAPFMLLLFWSLCVRKRTRALVQRFVPAPYRLGAIVAGCVVSLVMCSLIPQVVGNAVRRQQEWQADVDSVAILNSHEGGLGFVNRMYRDFGCSFHNPHFGILSDHPSSWERRAFFLDKKHNCTT